MNWAPEGELSSEQLQGALQTVHGMRQEVVAASQPISQLGTQTPCPVAELWAFNSLLFWQ